MGALVSFILKLWSKIWMTVKKLNEEIASGEEYMACSCLTLFYTILSFKDFNPLPDGKF